MLFEYQLPTSCEELYDITTQIQNAIDKSNVASGIAVVYCIHTTAGLTISENSDPDVKHDILMGLNKAYPKCDDYKHVENNSVAYLKATTMGSSIMIIIENSKPLLGTWQSVYFCEFDQPRERKFYIKILAS